MTWSFLTSRQRLMRNAGSVQRKGASMKRLTRLGVSVGVGLALRAPAANAAGGWNGTGADEDQDNNEIVCSSQRPNDAGHNLRIPRQPRTRYR